MTIPTAAVMEAPTEATHRGKVITVTSAKSGAGKNTVALCLATAMHRASPNVAEGAEPLRVCVIDLDNRDGQVGLLLGSHVPNTLGLYLATSQDEGVTAAAVNGFLSYYEDLGIYALIAPKRAPNTNAIPVEFYAGIIDVVSKQFDVTVLVAETNVLDEISRKVALPVADEILYVTNLSLGSIHDLNRWLEEVTVQVDEGGAGVEASKVSVVLNQAVEGLEEDKPVGPVEGVTVAGSIPVDSSIVIASRASLDAAVTGDTSFAKAYDRLAKHLLPR